jgi:aminocarboxymuconate-semialdehyde decarboxylase
MRSTKPPVIDFHAHVIEPEVFKQCIDHSVATGFGARPMPLPQKDSPGWQLFGGMLDPAIQIRDLDRKGIDINVIATSTVVQSSWWAEQKLAAELERRANERIARTGSRRLWSWFENRERVLFTDPRFQKLALWNGIFETFPDVKVVIVHGGGYLPHYTARLDRNVTAHPISANNIKRLPSEF